MKKFIKFQIFPFTGKTLHNIKDSCLRVMRVANSTQVEILPSTPKAIFNIASSNCKKVVNEMTLSC